MTIPDCNGIQQRWLLGTGVDVACRAVAALAKTGRADATATAKTNVYRTFHTGTTANAVLP